MLKSQMEKQNRNYVNKQIKLYTWTVSRDVRMCFAEGLIYLKKIR